MMSASMQGALAFQKGLGCVHSLSHSLGGVDPRLHHGTLNAMFLPAVVRFNAQAESVRNETAAGAHGACDGARERGRHPGSDPRHERAAGPALRAWPRWAWSAAWFEKIIDGAMADHCHKTNPRIASREDYLEMLEASM